MVGLTQNNNSEEILSELEVSLNQFEAELKNEHQNLSRECGEERTRLEHDLKIIQDTLGNLYKVYQEKLKASTQNKKEKEDLKTLFALYEISNLFSERSKEYVPLINIGFEKLISFESKNLEKQTATEELQSKIKNIEDFLNDPETIEEFSYHENIRTSKKETVDQFAQGLPARYKESYLEVINARKEHAEIKKQIAEVEENKKYEVGLEALKNIREKVVTLPITYLSDKSSEINFILPIVNKKDLSPAEDFLVNLYQVAVLESISELINDEGIKTYSIDSDEELIFKNYTISGLPLGEEGKEQRILDSLSWRINEKLINLESFKPANLKCGKFYQINSPITKIVEEEIKKRIEERIKEYKLLELKKIEGLVPEGYVSEERAIEILFDLDQKYPVDQRKSNLTVESSYVIELKNAKAEFKEAEEEGMLNETIKVNQKPVEGTVYFKLEDVLFYKKHCLLPAVNSPKNPNQFVWFDEEILTRQQAADIGGYEKGLNAIQMLINSNTIQTVQKMYPAKAQMLADQEEQHIPKSALMFALSRLGKTKK